MLKFDLYQQEELQPSWANQLDKVGMQPHAREYLECEMGYMRSDRQLYEINDQYIDYPEGIQFSGKP